MNRLIVISSIFTLSACTLAPVNHKQLDQNKYQVTVHGNAFLSHARMREKVDKKAKKLCKDDFVYEGDGEFGSNTVPTYINGAFVDVTSFYLSRVVSCTVVASDN